MVGRCHVAPVAPLPLPPSPSLFLPSSLCFWTPLLCQYRAGCQNSSPQALNIQALLPQSRKPDRRKMLQAHRKPCPKSPRKPPGHPRTNRCPLSLLDCPASCTGVNPPAAQGSPQVPLAPASISPWVHTKLSASEREAEYIFRVVGTYGIHIFS